jgi:hypothetical protein
MGEMRQGISAELMLLNWNESANSGCKLIFEIAPDELEPFKNLKTRAGKKVAGQRFAAVLVLIDDDESVVPPQATPVPTTHQEAKAQLNDNASMVARKGGFSDASASALGSRCSGATPSCFSSGCATTLPTRQRSFRPTRSCAISRSCSSAPSAASTRASSSTPMTKRGARSSS